MFTQSSAPENGRDQRPKHVELIEIINKPLLLHLVGVYIIYINYAGQTNIKLIFNKWFCLTSLNTSRVLLTLYTYFSFG